MITKYPIKASDVDVSYMQKQLTEDIADIANRAYEQGRADVLREIVEASHCEDADCFECAFGAAEGCVIEKMLEGETEWLQ